MSDSKSSSRLSTSNLCGVDVQPMSLPPLSLPPIKTDHLGLSPLSMTSYPSPGVSRSSLEVSSNPLSEPVHSTSIQSFSQLPSTSSQRAYFPVQSQQQHPTTSALLSKARVGSAGGQPTGITLQHHVLSSRSHFDGTGQTNSVERQIRSVPGSPNPGSNPPTPCSLPVMRNNSMEMVCSPNSSHGQSPVSHSNKSSPCPSPRPNNGTSTLALEMRNSTAPFHQSFGETNQSSGSDPSSFRSNPTAMSPTKKDIPFSTTDREAINMLSNKNHERSINSAHIADTSSKQSVNSGSNARRPRAQESQLSSHSSQGVQQQSPSQAQPLSSQAIVQHLPLRNSSSGASSSANQAGVQSSSLAMIQHHPLPPVSQVPNVATSEAHSSQHFPSTSVGIESFRPHESLSAAHQDISSHGQLLQQRLMQTSNSVPPAEQQSTSSGPQLTHQQIKQILTERALNAQASGSTPSPALQQVLASRSLQQQQRLQSAHNQPLQAQGPLHPRSSFIGNQSSNMSQTQAAHRLPGGIAPQPIGIPVPHAGFQPTRHQSAVTATMNLAQAIDERQAPVSSNKEQYRLYKKKFKYLVFENECYQEELRNLQRKLLKLSRDKNFLLDRLLQFEKVSDSSDDDSDSSQRTVDDRPKSKRRVRPAQRKRVSNSPLGSRGMPEGSMSNTPSPCPSPAPGSLLSQMLIPSTSGSNSNCKDTSPVKVQHFASPEKDDSKRMRLSQNRIPRSTVEVPPSSQAPSSSFESKDIAKVEDVGPAVTKVDGMNDYRPSRAEPQTSKGSSRLPPISNGPASSSSSALEDVLKKEPPVKFE